MTIIFPLDQITGNLLITKKIKIKNRKNKYEGDGVETSCFHSDTITNNYADI